MDAMQRVKDLLIEIYGPDTGREAWGRVAPLIEKTPRQERRRL